MCHQGGILYKMEQRRAVYIDVDVFLWSSSSVIKDSREGWCELPLFDQKRWNSPPPRPSQARTRASILFYVPLELDIFISRCIRRWNRAGEGAKTEEITRAKRNHSYKMGNGGRGSIDGYVYSRQECVTWIEYVGRSESNFVSFFSARAVWHLYNFFF